MTRTRRPRKCLGGAVIGAIDTEGKTGRSCLDSYLNRRRRWRWRICGRRIWSRGKVGRLGDGSHYGDGTRIIRSRIGARATASPIAEAITSGRRCADRDTAATGFPGARRTYLAAYSSVHRQVILGAEFRRVSRVLGWGDAM